MNGVVLDTSVVIAAERGALDLAAVADGDAVVISAITAHELLRGVARLPAGVRRSRSERWIEALLASVPVIDYDVDVARVHVALWIDLNAARIPMSEPDQMIAATALAMGYDLATRDSVFKQVPELEIRAW